MKPAQTVPVPSLGEAQKILSALVTGNWNASDWVTENPQSLSKWLHPHHLAPLAYHHCKTSDPELAALLKPSHLQTAANNLMRFHQFAGILLELSKAGVPITLLKGAALIASVYPDLAVRPMCDIDIWVRNQDMDKVSAILKNNGFTISENKNRPLAMQKLAKGEIQFHSKISMIELQWSPFKGWWMHYTTAVDEASVWDRCPPLNSDFGGMVTDACSCRHLRHMSPEDTIMHLAVHMAITHPFGTATLRGLIDLALTVQNRKVDWETLTKRAQQWRLSIPVWMVLHFANTLIDIPDAENAVKRLEPSCIRRFFLFKIVTTEMLLTGQHVIKSRARFILLLLQISRFRDLIHLLYRTFVPAQSWMIARYGKPTSRWEHLVNVVVKGEI